MKIKYTYILISAFTLILFSNCGGSSIESDAKKVAEIFCDAQELAQKAATGDMSALEESNKLTLRAEALQRDLRGKYSSPEENQKFLEVLNREMAKCK